jgi:ProP effector
MNFNAAHATIELLAAIWPNCFAVSFRDRKPLKVGVGKEIAALVEGAVTQEELDAALTLYTGSKPYLRAMTEGAARVDHDGNPAGTVSAEQAATARWRIKRIEARHSARVRARGLAIEEANLKANAEADEATRAAEMASGKRKPLLRMPRQDAAGVAQYAV